MIKTNTAMIIHIGNGLVLLSGFSHKWVGNLVGGTGGAFIISTGEKKEEYFFEILKMRERNVNCSYRRKNEKER